MPHYACVRPGTCLISRRHQPLSAYIKFSLFNMVINCKYKFLCNDFMAKRPIPCTTHRLTPTTLRWSTLSSASQERGWLLITYPSGNLCLCQSLQCIQYLLRGMFTLHLVDYLFYQAFLVHHESGAQPPHVRVSKSCLFSPKAVGFHNAPVGVGYQCKGQAEFRFKFFVRFFIIRANADHLETLANQ